MSQIGGDHYSKHDIEPWDALSCWLGPDGFADYLRGNCIKYLVRYRDKGGLEDLRKCKHYLQELMQVQETAEIVAFEDGQ